jgi:hypothetical protein
MSRASALHFAPEDARRGAWDQSSMRLPGTNVCMMRLHETAIRDEQYNIWRPQPLAVPSPGPKPWTRYDRNEVFLPSALSRHTARAFSVMGGVENFEMGQISSDHTARSSE